MKQMRKEEKRMERRRKGDADDVTDTHGIDPQIWKQQRYIRAL